MTPDPTQRKSWQTQPLDIKAMLAPEMSGYQSAVKSFTPQAPKPWAQTDQTVQQPPPLDTSATRPRKATTDDAAGRPRQVLKTFKPGGDGVVDRMKAERDAIAAQTGNDQTVKTPYGYENQPGKKLSRFGGVLQGLAEGWQQERAMGGGPLAAASGAATAGIAGGIQSRVVQALARKNLVAKQDALIGQQQQSQLRDAQIQEQQARARHLDVPPNQKGHFGVDGQGNQIWIPEPREGEAPIAQTITDGKGNVVQGKSGATKPPVTVPFPDGTRKTFNPETKKWETAKSDDPAHDSKYVKYTDKDGKEYLLSAKDVMNLNNGVDVTVGGQTVRATPGQFLNFEALEGKNDKESAAADAEFKTYEKDESEAYKRREKIDADLLPMQDRLAALENEPKSINSNKQDAKGQDIWERNPKYQPGEIGKLKTQIQKNRADAKSADEAAKSARDKKEAARGKIAGAAANPKSGVSKPASQTEDPNNPLGLVKPQ